MREFLGEGEGEGETRGEFEFPAEKLARKHVVDEETSVYRVRSEATGRHRGDQGRMAE